MSHSTHAGFRGPGSRLPSGHSPSRAICERRTEKVVPSGSSTLGFPYRSLPSLAVFPSGLSDARSAASGVGSNDEHPLAPV